MILSFNKEFIPKILDRSKRHTIREDKANRWKVGNKIHFYAGGYQAKRNMFAPVGDVIQIFDITIHTCGDITLKDHNSKKEWTYSFIEAYGRHHIDRISKNDGFKGYADFLDFFALNYGLHHKPFKGKLITWDYIHYPDQDDLPF